MSPLLPATSDHDYIGSRRGTGSSTCDRNNNRLDLLDSLLPDGTSSLYQNKLHSPVSPLSAVSGDFGYESAGHSPASDHSKAFVSSSTSFLLGEEDEFLMDSLDSFMQPSMLDPMLMDPMLMDLELFPEMF